jgi:site-specific DNA-cytosine methylase
MGKLFGKFRCVGGVDIDPAACADFEMMTGVKATRLDLMDEIQYRAFHGSAPPRGWRPTTPDDIWRSQGCETPDVAFMSCPCKGFSGLLSEAASKSEKYQALNGLTLRGLLLLLEANKNNPIKIILFENVPRIATRGRFFLDQIEGLLRAYGYAVQETEHDCGEIGGLGQSRKRFLLVARYMPKVPNFLYEPVKQRLRGVGEVLDRLPMPLTGFGGPLHRMPALQWKTWVRLALVEAGSDWRSLNRLAVEDGILRDYGIAPDTNWHRGVLGVRHWEEPAGVVTGRALPACGAHAVADPRAHGPYQGTGKYRVTGFGEPAGVVIGASTTGQGAFSVADPRVDRQARRSTLGVLDWSESAGSIRGESLPTNGAFAVSDPRVNGHHKSVQLGVRRWDQTAGVVTGRMIAGGGPHSVADPRLEGVRFNHVFRVVRYDEASPAVAGPGGPASGLAVADPRPVFTREGRDKYLSAGHYGVVPYDATSRAITGAGQHDNSFNSVADPRVLHSANLINSPESDVLPAANDKVICVIRSIDGTWHRPFTTLECAALQSMFDPEKYFTAPEDYWDLHGMSDSAKRERIGNAVPRASAKGMGETILRCLLAAENGETFMLSNEPIWVQPVALALAAASSARGE